MKILEVNDNDIYGKVFNGYDICEHLNNHKDIYVKQIVLNKFTTSENVFQLYKTRESLDLDYLLNKSQKDLLSVQSIFSFNNYFLKNNDYYQKCDLVHYHQVHNSHLALQELFDMFKEKPTVLTLHDPWFMTGRCVHPMDCQKWMNGCTNCKHLKTLFDFEEDNSNLMWNLKSQISSTDIDIIVSSKFMYEMVKNSPYLKEMRVHLLPFGLDLKKYIKIDDKKQLRKELNIPDDDIVLFFREQKELKGTNYIVDALKKANFKQHITLLTCSQTGLLTELEKKYNIIELGNLSEDEIIKCYQASDIFLMPSIGESFGMMAIEAMACSLPVIVFNNTALPSVTNAPKIGVLVKNKDADDLRDKISYLINNVDERIKRGKLGRKYAEETYNINKYYKDLEVIYQESYEKQKYKLKSFIKSENRKIDFSSKDNQRILFSLKEIIDRIYLANYDYNLLNKLNPNTNEGIVLNELTSYEDFLAIAREFNIELAHIIEKIDNKFNIKKTKLYQTLKKSRLLVKIVGLLRKVKNKIYNIINRKYNYLNNEINAIKNVINEKDLEIQELNKSLDIIKDSENLTSKKYNDAIKDLKLLKTQNEELSNNYKELELKTESLKEENDNLRIHNNELTNDIKRTNDLLEKKYDEINRIIFEDSKSFEKMNDLLEFKLWENNNLVNEIMYYDDLLKKKQIQKFNPLISIIIPSYNGSNYLEEAINSAINQTYKNIEIIVVDDGTDDNGKTKAIVDKYKDRLHYYYKDNGGVSSALNYGIKKMKGDYFSWLSHDDLMESNHIQKLVEFYSYEGNESSIPFSNVKYMDENGNINYAKTVKYQLVLSDYKKSKNYNYKSLLEGEINGGSVLIPKEAFKTISYFDENLRITQERDMWSKLIEKYHFINIPFATSIIREHSAQVSSKKELVQEESNKKSLSIIEDKIKNIDNDMLMEIEYFYHLNGNDKMANKIREIINKRR